MGSMWTLEPHSLSSNSISDFMTLAVLIKWSKTQLNGHTSNTCFIEFRCKN